MSMEAVRFRTHIKKGNMISIPSRYNLENQDAEVIVLVKPLIEKTTSTSWRQWIEQRVLAGAEIPAWSREEIYEARLRACAD